MATKNPFDILGDDDNDDPSSLIAIHQQKIAAKKPAGADSAAPSKAPAKLPTKPLPPAQAVREAKADVASRSGGGGGRGGRGRGGRIGGATQNKDLGNENIERFGGSYGGGGGGQDGEAGKGGSYGQPRQSYGGYRHGGYGEGDGDERPPRRVFERRSGTGRGNDFKREGSGRGNWGTVADDVIAQESVEAVSVENASPEKKPDQENAPGYEAKKEKEEGATNDGEQKEEEVKEMTLEEYEKVREEKRKALISMKAKERKVDVDKELQSMQQLSLKKENDDVFIKLGSDKDSRKQKDNADRDEKTKKSVSINEFLKPAAGGRYNGPGGRGRGRGSGGRGGFERGDSATPYVEAMIKIEDPGQFPILGGK